MTMTIMATITITATATIRTRIEPTKKNGPHIGGPFFCNAR
jgi:hypothetical protein